MFLKFFALVLTVYFVFLCFLYISQDWLIFVKAKPNYLLYDQLEPFSERLNSDGCFLQGWKIEGHSPKSNIVFVYFGGNAEDVALLQPVFSELNGSFSYSYNYRGYGLSEGEPSEKNLYADAVNVFDSVVSKYPDKEIVVIGNSLGSAVAGYLATQRQVDKLVLIAPLYSIERIADTIFFRMVPSFIFKHPFDLGISALTIRSDVLVLASKGDEIIPFSHSKGIFEKIRGKKVIKEIENVGHNDFFLSRELYDAISDFVSE